MSVINSIDEWNIASEKWRGRRELVKTAATFTLAQFEQWSKEFVDELGGDGSNDLPERLTLSSFICWIKQNKSKENPNG